VRDSVRGGLLKRQGFQREEGFPMTVETIQRKQRYQGPAKGVAFLKRGGRDSTEGKKKVGNFLGEKIGLDYNSKSVTVERKLLLAPKPKKGGVLLPYIVRGFDPKD